MEGADYCKNFNLTHLVTPIRAQILNNLLCDTGYDPTKTKFLIDGFEKGFDLEYTGNREVKMTSPNLKFVVGNKLELWNKIMAEVRLGRYAGPFSTPPFEYYIQSPLGLVPKDGNKTRLIFHLSHPRGRGTSVNANTDTEKCTVKYKDFDCAIKLLLKLGKNCKVAKSDCTSAFRHLCIKKKDWPLLVMRAESPFDGKMYYFVDKCLPFGHSISCALFQKVSDAISHIIKVKTQHENINYLDDFFFGATVKVLCNQQVRQFNQVCGAIGMPVSVEKTFWATTQITFLGLLIDTVRQLICVPLEKIERLLKLIKYVLIRKNITLRELQVVCGHLNFVCKSVVPGRAFTRRLYFATAGVNLKPHHHVRVSKRLKADLTVWETFLHHPAVFCRNFIEFENVLTAEQIDLFTDASRSARKGMGGYCGSSWFSQKWDKQFIDHYAPSIAYLELYAVTTGVLLWIHRFRNKRIILFCDNESVVCMVNKNTSHCKRCLVLIRIIVLESMIQNVRIYAKHVGTKQNGIADSLSRGQFERFSMLTQGRFAKVKSEVPQKLWPMEKVWLQA